MRISPDRIDPNALSIAVRLREAGFVAYIVGGAVRDLVMGNVPKDTDIVTDASPDQVASLFERTVPVGERFGVTLVLMHGESYEVAQFRSDGPYSDGRRPVRVTPSSVREDAKRRDFTINALLCDPSTGDVLDYTGGLADIDASIIRTIGEPSERFAEDRLRMLRAVRFAARFGFTIEPATMTAIQSAARTVTDVSAERIGSEIGGIICGPHPDKGLDLLDMSGLLAVILPEVAALKGVEQPPEFHPEGDVYTHTREMLRLFGGGSRTLGFGILLHDIGKPPTRTVTDRIRFNRHDAVGADMAKAILRRLRMPTAVIERVMYLVAAHMRFMNVPDMRESTLRRFMAEDGFTELLELYRLDCLASHGGLTTYEMITGQIEGLSGATDIMPRMPKPFIGGDDLIALGYVPGPRFRDILDWIYDEQLEGLVKTAEDAKMAIRDAYPLPGGKDRRR